MFWQSIATLLEGYKISITVQKNDNGTLTAIIIPKARKEDKEGLAPISLTGTPEEFDSPEILSVIKGALIIAKEKFANVNMFIKALEDLEKKKKSDLDKKTGDKSKTTSSPAKKGPEKKMKTVPNPDFIPLDKRTEDNPDYDKEDYDEDEPETIEVEDESGTQKPLI
jgi:PRTRC genetic system protein E